MLKKQKKYVKTIAPERCFWVNNGPILRNVLELRDALKSMSEATFEHNVAKDRNDFAVWAESVLEDADLAKALKKSRTKSGVCRSLDFYIKSFYVI